MPIDAKWIQADLYWEYWTGTITRFDIFHSAIERINWHKQDNGKVYVVVIDLSNCKRLPEVTALREAAKVHEPSKARFILHESTPVFTTIGMLVSRLTGYTIVPTKSFNETINTAHRILSIR